MGVYSKKKVELAAYQLKGVVYSKEKVELVAYQLKRVA